MSDSKRRAEFVKKLMQIADSLDDCRLGMLYQEALNLRAEMPRKTNAEIIPFGRGVPAARRAGTVRSAS